LSARKSRITLNTIGRRLIACQILKNKNGAENRVGCPRRENFKDYFV
jgi:hypothetical protein